MKIPIANCLPFETKNDSYEHVIRYDCQKWETKMMMMIICHCAFVLCLILQTFWRGHVRAVAFLAKGRHSSVKQIRFHDGWHEINFDVGRHLRRGFAISRVNVIFSTKHLGIIYAHIYGLHQRLDVFVWEDYTNLLYRFIHKLGHTPPTSLSLHFIIWLPSLVHFLSHGILQNHPRAHPHTPRPLPSPSLTSIQTLFVDEPHATITKLNNLMNCGIHTGRFLLAFFSLNHTSIML